MKIRNKHENTKLKKNCDLLLLGHSITEKHVIKGKTIKATEEAIGNSSLRQPSI